MNGEGGPPDVAPVEAQVLFADCRAPGPVNASIGWKVKDVIEAPGSIPVGRHLLQAVDAIGQAYLPDPDLALADRSEQAPVVLKQVRLDDSVMLLAQFADAGIDRTGRASHSMHGLLHSAPLRGADGGFRRPVELYGSGLWLRPVGNDAVEGANLQDCRFDLPAGPVGLDEVIGDGFLTDLDRPERVAVLPLVLESLRVALDDDTTAVVVAADAEEAARWLALVSNLLDPVSACRLRFTTREDVLSASVADHWDFHWVGVVPPTGAAARAADPLLALGGSRVLVVDTRRLPTERPDGTWSLGNGDVLRRSTWTEIAETVLMSPVVTAGVRARLDELAEQVPGLDAAPTWALPVAALLTGADLPDPDGAVRWLFEHWPTGATVTGEVADELEAVLVHVIGGSGALVSELSASMRQDVPAFLADAVIAGAVRHDLASRDGALAPGPGRSLSAVAAEALAAELPDVLAWIAEEPPADRLAAVLRAWAVADAAGLPRAAVAAALRPVVTDLVQSVVDPEFDPVAAGWPELPPDVWSNVFAYSVDDALMTPGTGAEVSGSTHEWLTSSLSPDDRPESAAERRSLRMSSYGLRRAAWTGAAGDAWSTAVFAVGMMHVNVHRFGRSTDEAAELAIRRAFGGHPVPVSVAECIVETLDPSQARARLVVARAAFADGEFRAEQRRFADRLRPEIQQLRDVTAAEVVPAYVTLMHDHLLKGGPSTAVSSNYPAVTRHLVRHLDGLEPPALREGTRRMLARWSLQLPVWSVRAPDGPPEDDTVPGTLRLLAPTDEVLDAALERVLAQGDQLVFDTVSHLLVRVGLAVHDHREGPYDPLFRWLSRIDDREQLRVLRGPLSTWLADRGKPGYATLEKRWTRVVDELSSRGWQARARELDEDRRVLMDALQSRSLLSRRGRRG